MKYFYILITSSIAIYLILLIVIYFNQRNLLYLPSENNNLDDPIKFVYEEHFIKVDKDIKIKSWLIKKDLNKYKTLLFLHGNAGNLFNRSYKLNELNKLELNILIISWRGFSGNPGKPTEANLYKDAKKAVTWLNDKGVKSKNIILSNVGSRFVNILFTVYRVPASIENMRSISPDLFNSAEFDVIFTS